VYRRAIIEKDYMAFLKKRGLVYIMNKISKMINLNRLAEEFAKIGIKMQSPKISAGNLRNKIIEKWNLNNIQEQWERQKLLRKS